MRNCRRDDGTGGRRFPMPYGPHSGIFRGVPHRAFSPISLRIHIGMNEMVRTKVSKISNLSEIIASDESEVVYFLSFVRDRGNCSLSYGGLAVRLVTIFCRAPQHTLGLVIGIHCGYYFHFRAARIPLAGIARAA